MSIAIIGGNECMERRYIDACKQFGHKAKVFTKPKGIKDKIGTPDIVVLFTNTVSHKMVYQTLSNINESKSKIVRTHSSSVSSLKNILETI